jgi:hypothetical protein
VAGPFDSTSCRSAKLDTPSGRITTISPSKYAAFTFSPARAATIGRKRSVQSKPFLVSIRTWPASMRAAVL